MKQNTNHSLDGYLYFVIVFILVGDVYCEITLETGGSGIKPSGGEGNVIVRRCEPIAVERCMGMGYKMTAMPNLLGHETQQEALVYISSFNLLIKSNCSRQLQFLLCSVNFPLCDEKILNPIGPCRPLCEHVRNRCLKLMKNFSYNWPDFLACDNFPVENDQHNMCMHGPEVEESDEVFDGTLSQNSITNTTKQCEPKESNGPCYKYKNSQLYVYINTSKTCALKCDAENLYTNMEKYFVERGLLFLVILCFTSTLFTVCTFIIHSTRFRYPERAIILLAFCYNLVSVGYIIRISVGKYDVSCAVDPFSGTPILLTQGLDNTNCGIMFLFLYYFGMAAACWWLVLTFTWFLSAGLKWSHEAIQRHSSHFHLIAWGVPALLTVSVLVMRGVDADELSGLCYVGYQQTQMLLVFVIIPNIICIVMGTIFLLAGQLALCHIKKTVAKDGIKTSGLEVLILRIGIFSTLYTVPVICVLACQIYEYRNRDGWANACFTDVPRIEVIIIKTFMTLIAGIIASIWIWSKKTISSWKNISINNCQKKSTTSNFPKHNYQGTNSSTIPHGTEPPLLSKVKPGNQGYPTLMRNSPTGVSASSKNSTGHANQQEIRDYKIQSKRINEDVV